MNHKSNRKSWLIWLGLIATSCTLFGHPNERMEDSVDPCPPLYENLGFNGKQLLIDNFLWDATSGKELRQFPVQPRSIVTAARFSPDSKRVLIATAENTGTVIWKGTVKLWDAATEKEIFGFAPTNGFVSDVQFSPDAKRILATLEGALPRDSVQIWDVKSGRHLTLSRLDAPVFNEQPASFSPDGSDVLVLSWEKIGVFDSTTGKPVRTITMKPSKDMRKPDFIASTRFSPDGKLLLSEQCNGVTRIWNAATGQQVQVFADLEQYPGGGRDPYALFTPDGRRVISGSYGGTAVLWDIESGKEIRRFQTPGGTGSIYQMTISRDGKRLITTCYHLLPGGIPDDIDNLWNVESGKQLLQWTNRFDEKIAGFSPVDETFVTVKDTKPAAVVYGRTGLLIRGFIGSSQIKAFLNTVTAGIPDQPPEPAKVVSKSNARKINGRDAWCEVMKAGSLGFIFRTNIADDKVNFEDVALDIRSRQGRSIPSEFINSLGLVGLTSLDYLVPVDDDAELSSVNVTWKKETTHFVLSASSE